MTIACSGHARDEGTRTHAEGTTRRVHRTDSDLKGRALEFVPACHHLTWYVFSAIAQRLHAGRMSFDRPGYAFPRLWADGAWANE